MARKTLPGGMYPVMLTPFFPDGAVDHPCLTALTEWYVASGASGLFTVAQSSEMWALSPDERLAVAATVKVRRILPACIYASFCAWDSVSYTWPLLLVA